MYSYLTLKLRKSMGLHILSTGSNAQLPTFQLLAGRMYYRHRIHFSYINYWYCTSHVIYTRFMPIIGIYLSMSCNSVHKRRRNIGLA